ncbi:MAG: hypothetical protein ACRCYP_02120 [Alphaproteobacteria bacterium]
MDKGKCDRLSYLLPFQHSHVQEYALLIGMERIEQLAASSF